MFLFLFTPLLTFLFTSSLRSLLANQSTQLHLLCLKILPLSAYLEVNQALVCGENLKNQTTKQLFIDTGLYHLIVVSGSHLVLIAAVIEWFLARVRREKKNGWIEFATLFCFFFYTMMCGLEPPLVRACFAQVLILISRRQKLNLSEINILMLSVFCCFLFEPNWSQSLSLLLSATTSLSLLFTRKVQNPFSKQLFIYFCISPVLFGWGNLHPLTILINVLIAPIVSLILLPFAIVSIPLPFLADPLDWLYQFTFQILSWLSIPAKSFQGIDLNSHLQILSKPSLWIYFFGLCGAQFILHLRRFRDPK